MEEYICHYLTDPVHSARVVIHAEGLGEAMGAFNSRLPEYSESVLKWTGPTGITFLMHDSKIGMGE